MVNHIVNHSRRRVGQLAEHRLKLPLVGQRLPRVGAPPEAAPRTGAPFWVQVTHWTGSVPRKEGDGTSMHDDWELHEGGGPLIATAIHAGHAISPEFAALSALSEDGRLREEDPFTDAWTVIASTRIVMRRSRFEVDVNRPRDESLYQS